MDTILSVLVLVTIALQLGAFFLWRRGGARRQVVLMVVLAVVAIINIGIWTIPDASGENPLAQIKKQENAAR